MFRNIITYIRKHSRDSVFGSILFGVVVAVLAMIYNGEVYPKTILICVGLTLLYIVFRYIKPIK
jgi:hypothetical protein